MNLEKVTFGFFIVLALTLNVAFITGDPERAHRLLEEAAELLDSGFSDP